MIATQSYMPRTMRVKFAAKNGGIEGLRTEYPVIAGLLETNLVLDALVDAYAAGDKPRLAGQARAVRLVEAASAQLREPGMARVSLKRTELMVEHEGDETRWVSFHTPCGWRSEPCADGGNAMQAGIDHECEPHTEASLSPMSRADREAFAAANDGVEGLREKGHYAVSRLLASTEQLDRFMDALDSGDDAAVAQIASQCIAMDAEEASR